MPKLILTEELRQSLKNPLGTLYCGKGPKLYHEIAELVSAKNPPKVIFVGDAVSRNATAAHLRRDVMIIDRREKRRRTRAPQTTARNKFRVRNEPGTISPGAWVCLEKAIRSGDALVTVDGEEDLMTLVAMATAPLGSFVIYGQPDEGLVLIQIDVHAKKVANSFFEGMIKRD